MLATLLAGLTALGLGAWMPAPEKSGERLWLGLRLMAGFCLMVALPYFLHLAAGVGLRHAALATAALGGAGLVRLGIRHRRALLEPHPVPILAAAVAALLALRGLDYAPLAWDELSNWLAWTRAAIEADRLTGPNVLHGVPGYTSGWPLALAFPGLLAGGFEFNRAALVPFLMHLGFAGLLYDVLVGLFARRGLGRSEARLAAWATLLSLLAAEAAWKLVPTNLLIEKPQIYLLAGWAALAWLMLDDENVEGAPYLGVLFLGGYLVKVSMLAFAGPALLVVGWMCWRRRERPFAPLALAFAPTLAAYGLWRITGWLPGCMSEPLAVARGLLEGGEQAGRAIDLAQRLFGWIGDYFVSFKLHLTVPALAGFALIGTRAATRPLAISFILYLGLYFGALYAYHLTCFGDFYFQTLNSPDRFTRVPLRVLHVLGAMALALWALPRLPLHGRGKAAMLAVLVALTLWQVRQTDGAVRTLTTRWDADPGQVAIVVGMKDEARAIIEITAGMPEDSRKVTLIAQGDDGYRKLIAGFFGAGRFDLAGGYSWGEVPANTWMLPSSPEALRVGLRKAGLIWPVIVDPWMVGVLRPLVRDERCLERPEAHYFRPQPDGTLACRPKPAANEGSPP